MASSSFRLSDRDRRTVLLGTGIVLSALLLGRGIPAFLQWTRTSRLEATRTAADLAFAKADLGQAQSLQDSLNHRQQRYSSLSAILLSGDTPAAAAASLSTIVSEAAARTNVTVGALELTADTISLTRRPTTPSSLGSPASPSHTPPNTLLHVSARGEATSDIRGLTHFFAALEKSPVLLSVTRVVISPAQIATPDDHMEVLHAEFTVVGLTAAISNGGTSEPRKAA